LLLQPTLSAFHALDNDCLGRAGRACYRSGTLAAERVAVLASAEDLVLRFAYPLGDLGQSVLFGERWGTALGRTGPFEPDGPTSTKLERVPLSKASADVDHGDYLHLDRPPAGTLSASEEFVAGFLNRTPPYRWPSSR
jgi:hypothetical protein